MAPVNPEWHRWVYASVAKYLHAAAADTSVLPDLPLVVEFLDERPPSWDAATSKAEATVTGPMTKEISKGCHRMSVDVYIVLTSFRSKNDYNHIDLCGKMANALDGCIICKDYGGTGTGTVELGVLRLRSEDGDEVDVEHLKPASKDTQIHSIIQARMRGFFTE